MLTLTITPKTKTFSKSFLSAMEGNPGATISPEEDSARIECNLGDLLNLGNLEVCIESDTPEMPVVAKKELEAVKLQCLALVNKAMTQFRDPNIPWETLNLVHAMGYDLSQQISKLSV